jgi:hypothetical protein
MRWVFSVRRTRLRIEHSSLFPDMNEKTSLLEKHFLLAKTELDIPPDIEALSIKF